MDETDICAYHTRFESKSDECCTCNSKGDREGPRVDSCWEAPKNQPTVLSRKQSPTGFCKKRKGSCLSGGYILHKLFHVLTDTMNQQHGDHLAKGVCRLQIYSCYFWGASSVFCFAARTLGSSIIFVLISLSIIQRLIVFYALEKFANTSELNCLAVCRFHVIWK